MRTDGEKLRGCPVCGTRVKDVDLHLRDFHWVNQELPGKVGMMDVDAALERNGWVLHLEMKPGAAPLPLGQRLTFKTYVRLGIDVWVVWTKTRTLVEVGQMDANGELSEVRRMKVSTLARKVRDWYEYADANPRRLPTPGATPTPGPV